MCLEGSSKKLGELSEGRYGNFRIIFIEGRMWMKEEDIVCEEIYWEILFIFSEVFGLVLGVLVGSLLDMKLEKLVFCLYLIFGRGI